jgi:hypothetical protein
MKLNVIGAAVVSAFLVSAAFAEGSTQGAAGDSSRYGSGESKRCEPMSGAEKEQCLRDEATKTQGSPGDSSTSGESSAPGTGSSGDGADSQVSKPSEVPASNGASGDTTAPAGTTSEPSTSGSSD